jgi:tubulin polyglutamylase TTLL1
VKNASNRYVHLTNDAVQKRLDDYGKFESGNKLSYADFQKYADGINLKIDFQKQVVTQIKQLVQDSFRALSRKVDPHRKQNSFEIFGYDFMIDEDVNVWLIEVNTNPCLELSSPYLARLVPAMVDNALK